MTPIDGSGKSMGRYKPYNQISIHHSSSSSLAFTNLSDRRNALVQILPSPLPKQVSLQYGLNHDYNVYKTKSLAFLR